MAIKLSINALLKSFCLCVFTFAAVAIQASTIRVPADQPTIQAGINAAATGDTVLVSPGTYYENIDFKGKAITVTSSGGATQTIIDGGGIGPVATFESQESRSSVLSNFTLRNGGGFNNSTMGSAWGGVFTTYFSNPTILNNLILNNACNGYYGSGGALLQGNTISGTTRPPSGLCNSFGAGAGVYIYGGAAPFATVIGNLIENNLQTTAFNGGAVVVNVGGSPVIENNTIRNNAMTGFRMANTNALTFVQNLVYGNASGDGAGGLQILVPSTAQFNGTVLGVIANNTFVGNGGTAQVFLDGDLSQFDFVNNIIVGASQTPGLLCNTPTSNYIGLPVVIDHNDIFNPTGQAYGNGCPDQTGTYGNISVDPGFANPSTADFHPRSGSPAIDAGNTSVATLLSKDFDGNPRPVDATSKQYPIVDMGAFEFQGLADANPTTIVLTPSLYKTSGGATIQLVAKFVSANGIPTGLVTFTEDGSDLGPALIDAAGNSSYTTPGLTPGIHAFTASYPGQSAFTPAISVKIFVLVDNYPAPLQSTTTALRVSPVPAYAVQPVTLTGLVVPTAGSGSPTGSFTFYDNGVSLATVTAANGQAFFTTTSLTAGNHILQAVYSGNTSFASSSSNSITENILLNPTSTTLTITPGSSTVANRPIAFTVQVNSLTSVPFSAQPCAGCHVTLTVVGLPPNVASTYVLPAVNGSATFNFGLGLGAGTYSFTATFSGNSIFGTAFADSTSASVGETVFPAPTTLNLSASPNPATQNQAVKSSDAEPGCKPDRYLHSTGLRLVPCRNPHLLRRNHALCNRHCRRQRPSSG